MYKTNDKPFSSNFKLNPIKVSCSSCGMEVERVSRRIAVCFLCKVKSKKARAIELANEKAQKHLKTKKGTVETN